LELGWTYLVQELDLSGKSYWNPAWNLDKTDLDEDKERTRHVWAGGQTCPANASRIRLEEWICPDFLESWFGRYFFDDLQFTNSLNASPLIVQSS
jgi:hypothetical protein